MTNQDRPKPQSPFKGTDTPAEKKLVSFLKKRDPNLTEKELSTLLNGIRRFVVVVQKIYTQPQAQTKYKEVVENGIKTKNRIIETDKEELSKVTRGRGKPIIETFREFNERITGDKYKIHGK